MISKVLIKATEIKQQSDSNAALNLSIRPGTITSIIGPQPAEKSRWLKILAGLEDFEQGKLHLLERDLTTMNRQSWQKSRQKIAYMGANTSLLSAQNIIDNVTTPALYHGLGKRGQLEEKALGLLTRAGYNDRRSLYLLPSYVEFEQRYLAMLVRVLLLQPKVLCIDKLFSKIGVMAKNNVHKLLQQEIRNNQLAVILNTRNLDFAARYSETIVFVSRSTVFQCNTFEELKQSTDPVISGYLKNYYMN